MKKIFIVLILISSSLIANEEYNAFVNELETSINKKTVWYSKYHNFQTYNTIEDSLKDIKKEIRKYKKKRKYKKLSNLEQQKELKLNELELLKEYEHSSFGNLLRVKTIKEQPNVTNPIGAIGAVSFIQSLESEKSLLSDNLLSLNKNISEIINMIEVANSFMDSKEDNLSQEYIGKYKTILNELISDLENFQTAKNSYQSTIRVYSQRANDVISILSSQVKSEIIKLLYIIAIIALMILVSYFSKVFLDRYISDHKNIYATNKAINVSTIIVIVLIILFSYLENVTYLATVLGFASAGIAIAMRDWFMSILGWMVIMIGGSIHVGDRVRFSKSNQIYLGDVLDISMLRITLHETVTYTTYTTNRRAGRIVFVPNNFIFSSMISNYSHGGMKTVWDGLDVTITFDSNHKKALFIAKEVATQLSKGYTSIARKQLNLLRREYNLKTTQVDPQCFSLLESYGMRISIWYQTNSYATLVLRSTLSSAILERYQQEDDIVIAYKTQDINLKEVPIEVMNMYKIENIKLTECDNPKFVKTQRMHYTQDGHSKAWEIVLNYDSVSILLIDEGNDRFVLVKQFRPPVYLKNNDGFTHEICAGIVDKDLPLIQIAREEALEECGYDVPLENIYKINEMHSGVGFSGAKQTLYFAYINDDMKVSEGGGIDDEVLEVFYLNISKSKQFIDDISFVKTPGLAYAITKYLYDKGL